ncbi:hypothetical protein Bbelb_377250 [Branchiostoma belcheri]|nr:hypothetical protein Bbelb_377250 [Branchiostoma belcheri]
MSHIPDDHPDILTYFKSGGISVQIGEGNPFGRIPMDQACKETVNKGTETACGSRGFSLKPNAESGNPTRINNEPLTFSDEDGIRDLPPRTPNIVRTAEDQRLETRTQALSA